VPLGGVVDTASRSDLYAVLRVAGCYAAPILLTETGWLASSAGFSVNEQPMMVGPVRTGETLPLERDGNGWRLFGRVSRLPWGRDAGSIALIATDPDGRSMVVFCDGVQGARPPTGERNMAGEPRDTYEFAGLGLSGNEVAPAAPDTAVNYAQERKSSAVRSASSRRCSRTSR
jgi:acyl-CoA dehydrogenase